MSHMPQYQHQQQPVIPLVGLHQPHEQKGYAQINQYASSPSLHHGDSVKDIEERSRLKKLGAKIYKRYKIMSGIARGFSAILNMIMFAFMALVIGVFYASRDNIALGRNIWPKTTTEWPTFLLLGASFLTFAGSVITVIIYCCCFNRAAESWKLAAFGYVIHIGTWLIVTFIYRYEKKLDDLWGWSCSEIAWKLQDEGHTSVNFERLCTVQVSSCSFLAKKIV